MQPLENLIILQTSFDVGWQSDKLVEPCTAQVVAQVILLLLGTEVKVSHDQCVLLGLNEILQEEGCSGEGLLLGTINCDDVHFPHDDLGELYVGLGKVVDAQDI